MIVWNSKLNPAVEALSLPKGSYRANFGFLVVEQSVSADHVLEAAQALIDAGQDVTVTNQAKLIVLAQEKGVAFTDWAQLQNF